jgi:hypothetical protein
VSEAFNTIRVFIPLAFRKKNGRPRILPPADITPIAERRQGPHVLRAIARAWGWRRMIENGEVATLTDLAKAEGVTISFVSRYLRLAYLSPVVLELLVTERRSCAVSIEALANAATLPWGSRSRLCSQARRNKKKFGNPPLSGSNFTARTGVPAASVTHRCGRTPMIRRFRNVKRVRQQGHRRGMVQEVLGQSR